MALEKEAEEYSYHFIRCAHCKRVLQVCEWNEKIHDDCRAPISAARLVWNPGKRERKVCND